MNSEQEKADRILLRALIYEIAIRYPLRSNKFKLLLQSFRHSCDGRKVFQRQSDGDIEPPVGPPMDRTSSYEAPRLSEERPRERWCRKLSYAASDQSEKCTPHTHHSIGQAAISDVKPFTVRQVSNHF